SRTNGLVEDIRQAYFTIDDRQRLEDELRPRELHDHDPGEAIDLPSNLKGGPQARPKAAPKKAPPARAPKKAEFESSPPPSEVAQLEPDPVGESGLRVPPPQRSVAEAGPAAGGN